MNEQQISPIILIFNIGPFQKFHSIFLLLPFQGHDRFLFLVCKNRKHSEFVQLSKTDPAVGRQNKQKTEKMRVNDRKPESTFAG